MHLYLSPTHPVKSFSPQPGNHRTDNDRNSQQPSNSMNTKTKCDACAPPNLKQPTIPHDPHWAGHCPHKTSPRPPSSARPPLNLSSSPKHTTAASRHLHLSSPTDAAAQLPPALPQHPADPLHSQQRQQTHFNKCTPRQRAATTLSYRMH